jgi:cytochrome b-561
MWGIDPVVAHYKPTEPKHLNPLQKLSMYLAQLFSLLSLLAVLRWSIPSNTSQGFLGGLGASSDWNNSPSTLFNWHPVCMVIAFTLCSTQAVFVYRYNFFHRYMGKLGLKTLHLAWHTIAMAFMIFGLYATIEWHHLENQAELYSLHSWLGISTVTLYSAQYFAGFWHFFFPGSRMETRRNYYPMHVVVGIFTYFTANFTIETGIAQQNYSNKCWYSLNWYTKDYNPATHYTSIPLGCRYSNGLGLCVFFTVICTTYALMDMKATMVRKSARRSSFLDME